MYKRGFGKILKYERKSWGMSRRRLAKLSHIEIDDLIDIETGKNITPSFFVLLNICEVLEISAFELVNGNTTMNELLKQE
ncbi:MAG: helix-turn-helix transcriptional regulator [bacterium]|nr:helix-turn-helix transcriptional regulator [bacterium]